MPYYCIRVLFFINLIFLSIAVKGSFATASCTRCKYQVRADDIREDIFAQRIPMCPECRVNSLPSLSEMNSNENYRGK